MRTWVLAILALAPLTVGTSGQTVSADTTSVIDLGN